MNHPAPPVNRAPPRARGARANPRCGAAELFLANAFCSARRRRWPRHSQVRGQLRQQAIATDDMAGNFWHSDVSCDPEPPLGSILYLREVPEVGGDTLFSSMYAAYEALSGPMKRLLEELTAVHSGEHIYRARYPNNKVKDRSDYGYRRAGRFPISEHPVLRTHPETKRTALYVNAGFTTRIKELEPDASQAILDFLFKHIQRPEFCCRLRWRKNSIAFWDNRCVQHYAVFDYFPAVRSGDRVTVTGDKPFYKTNLRSRNHNAAAE